MKMKKYGSFGEYFGKRRANANLSYPRRSQPSPQGSITASRKLSVRPSHWYQETRCCSDANEGHTTGASPRRRNLMDERSSFRFAACIVHNYGKAVFREPFSDGRPYTARCTGDNCCSCHKFCFSSLFPDIPYSFVLFRMELNLAE